MYLKIFQEQVLGMKWLNELIKKWILNLGINTDSKIGGSIQFFVYDVIKITILLCVLIFFVTYIQSYFPPERSKKIMGRFKGVKANFIGAFLGAMTPFCSCSSIPIFIGFTSAGLPLGMTFSFLISSPMINPGSLILLMSIFGTKIAITYVILGILFAVFGGILIEKMHMENYVEEIVFNHKDIINSENYVMTLNQRLKFSCSEVIATFKSVFAYIIFGVGIGAVIHNWIPEEFIKNILGSKNPLGVIIASIIGIPIYADIFGTIPIAEALLLKGAMLGTVISFMMAVTDLSLPSMIMLRKVLKPKLLGSFIAICTIGIILTGYIFNALHYILL